MELPSSAGCRKKAIPTTTNSGCKRKGKIVGGINLSMVNDQSMKGEKKSIKVHKTRDIKENKGPWTKMLKEDTY